MSITAVTNVTAAKIGPSTSLGANKSTAPTAIKPQYRHCHCIELCTDIDCKAGSGDGPAATSAVDSSLNGMLNLLSIERFLFHSSVWGYVVSSFVNGSKPVAEATT